MRKSKVKKQKAKIKVDRIESLPEMWKHILLSITVFLSFCSVPLAQESSQSGSILIEVKDLSGAVVPNALVKILPLPETLGHNLTTDRDGKLSLDLPLGTYDLSESRPGFRVARRHIEVQPGRHQKIDFVLSFPMGSSPNNRVMNAVPGSPFPEQSRAVSRDGRYAIVGVDTDTSPYHTVFLEDQVHKSRRKLFNYSRSIVVYWNDWDSKSFAVTDRLGSDSSRCSIFSVDENIPPVEVVDLLSGALGKDEQRRLKSLLSNHHAYVEALDWFQPDALEIKVWGYGEANPTGFTEFYGVRLPSRKP